MKSISAEKLLNYKIGMYYLPNVTKLKSKENIEVYSIFEFPCSQSLGELHSPLFSGFQLISVCSTRSGIKEALFRDYIVPSNKLVTFVEEGNEENFDKLLKNICEEGVECETPFLHISFLPEILCLGGEDVHFQLPKNKKLWVIAKSLRKETNTEKDKRLKDIQRLKDAFDKSKQKEVDKKQSVQKEKNSVFNEFLKAYPQVDKKVLIAMVGKS